ncbi:MAG: helix-turn-helix domain-containing protein [Candidatus Colwellbacteria bacterium]|nr:helix-turn-helix domain-containing protein [Candidatus Colwellbacteria bacterium]
MKKEFCSTTEAAKILGISRIAVFQKIQSGKIQAIKVGRNYVIETGQLLELAGRTLGEDRKRGIRMVVDRAMNEYGETFRKLDRE